MELDIVIIRDLSYIKRNLTLIFFKYQDASYVERNLTLSFFKYQSTHPFELKSLKDYF